MSSWLSWLSTLDELDLRAGGSLEIREVDHRPARELERPRLGRELHALALELGGLRLEVRRLPADVVDRVPFARYRVAALHEEPHTAPRQAIDPILQLS